MSVVVLYKSKTGFTEKYAKWIAEDVNADIFKTNEVGLDTLAKYKTIVFCGGLYAGGITGFSLIKKNFKYFKDKKLIVVAVGATLKKEDAIEEIKNHNLTSEMRDNVDFFLLRGGLNYKKMNLLDRSLMYLRVKSLKSKKAEELDNDAKGMIASYGKTVDFTNRNSIDPIVNLIGRM